MQVSWAAEQARLLGPRGAEQSPSHLIQSTRAGLAQQNHLGPNSGRSITRAERTSELVDGG